LVSATRRCVAPPAVENPPIETVMSPENAVSRDCTAAGLVVAPVEKLAAVVVQPAALAV
jgi:hypothetical protein